MTVTEPGIYPGIPEDTYHADNDLAPHLGRSLSASGAKVILKNPARYEWERRNPPPSKDAFDLGTIAHTLILGTGQECHVIDAEDWRSKAARDARDEARQSGKVPLLRKDYDAAKAMADAVRTHELAGKILSEGEPEKSLYWLDEPTGVTCRGRLDWWRNNAIVDVKTTRNGHPDDFERDAGNYGYHISAAHYVTGVETLTGARLPFVLIAVEKEPPHFVSVHQFDDDYLDLGARRMRHALELFAQCESSGVWPDYGNEIHTLHPPAWLLR